MDEDDEHEPSGPVVVLARNGEGYIAYIDPPLPTGSHRVVVPTKDAGWQAARELWQSHRLGFLDLANPDIERFADRY